MAAPKELHLIVLAPESTLLDARQVAWVHIKLANNKGVTIWPAHAPLLAETATETIHYEDQNGAQHVEFPSGILAVHDNVVTLFLDRTTGDSALYREKTSTGPLDRLAETLLAGSSSAVR